MSEKKIATRQAESLDSLYKQIDDRVCREVQIAERFETAKSEIEARFENDGSEAIQQYDQERLSTEQDAQLFADEVTARYRNNYQQTAGRFELDKQDAEVRFSADLAAAEKKLKDEQWESATVLEAAENDATSRLRDRTWQIKKSEETMDGLLDEARSYLEECKQIGVTEDPEPNFEAEEDPFDALESTLRIADDAVGNLTSLRLPRRMRFPGVLVFLVPGLLVLAVLAAVPLASVAEWTLPRAMAGGAIGAAFIGFGVVVLFQSYAANLVGRAHLPLRQTVVDMRIIKEQCAEKAEADHQRECDEARSRHEQDLRKVETLFQDKKKSLDQVRNEKVTAANKKYPPLLAQIEDQRKADIHRVEVETPAKLRQLKIDCEEKSAHILQRYNDETTANVSEHQDASQQLQHDWYTGMQEFFNDIWLVGNESHKLFPDWSGGFHEDWAPASEIPPAVRFGEFDVEMTSIEGGISENPTYGINGPTTWTMPALLPFPEKPSMLLKAHGDGRRVAVMNMQTVMLRFLSVIPPAKVRFTIIDPVGLGENFAAFMHLADFDEALVSTRIWTEPSHIEQKLADITEHMENVIQKYLRNEFQTLEEYNAHAGEVAEPYRFLVIANFPANFTEESIRRLLSIAASGARCGVYMLIAMDTKQTIPRDCDLQDLEKRSVTLEWQEDQACFQWNDERFNSYPIRLDQPPQSDQFMSFLQVVGQAAKDANRVEVPFELIAPDRADWWTRNSSLGFEVALGRAGATKLQTLALGRGTSQHVLIAGKTGSGKSTLLHALITNTALNYSPDEVELYLVDFKKGVEFKTYATYELPHARVVAVESEREFGLSVLQRLDEELKFRGDLFRQAGVQDLDGFRRSDADEIVPRVLLIVDEFQEFFVEDDKIAQESSLLLDRLVRQGRAFGIHIHLGSQTLGGAYTLARSTISQMAVRIALQCSESDAHLILSDENSSARLLSRPGEAIYNDANGMVEGNNFFQVVWLSDETRERYLRDVRELADGRGYEPRTPQIIFEGNVPSNLERNHLLRQSLDEDSPSDSPRMQAWLGEAVAIKDPTTAEFLPQSGCNMMVIGQHEEGALGIMLSQILGLAAQSASGETKSKFYILDGSAPDSQAHELFSKLAEWLPEIIQFAGRRQVPETINELADELSRREGANETDFGRRFLLVYNIGRFRDLRRDEDDFAFSYSQDEEKTISPSKSFGKILREGPDAGLHTSFWCDSVNNLNRTFDRQTLREFELRVLFQMNANDSSSLVDSPAAAKLGRNRALYYSEETGEFEKFRPYGIPTMEWISETARKIQSRLRSELPGVEV